MGGRCHGRRGSSGLWLHVIKAGPPPRLAGRPLPCRGGAAPLHGGGGAVTAQLTGPARIRVSEATPGGGDGSWDEEILKKLGVVKLYSARLGVVKVHSARLGVVKLDPARRARRCARWLRSGPCPGRPGP